MVQKEKSRSNLSYSITLTPYITIFSFLCISSVFIYVNSKKYYIFSSPFSYILS